MNKALYRRYRPETFQEVIGQEHVIAPLMAALSTGNTTHAYLFSGPRGCGKTTSARILARCLNCAEYPTDTPCGHCDSCRELAREGSGSLDVVEMDAASHGGVDDARELREEAGFAPVRDRFKIFIIDEAHMVSNQGFNALLKLVEEPPAHVKFIFATTEPEKVIGTIRSRTHHYPFRLVPPDVLEKYLEQVCESEGVKAGKDVLSLAVRAGTGSVRDTLSVLDQLIGGSDGAELDYHRAVALLGYTSAHLLDEAVEAIASGDGAALFGVVDSVVKTGHDPRRFVEDLLQRLRDLVIIALAGDGVKDVFLSVPEDQYALMCEQAQMLGAREASHAADVVNNALTAMVGATAPRIQLELLCARLIVARDDASASSGRSAQASAAPSLRGAASDSAPGAVNNSEPALANNPIDQKNLQNPKNRKSQKAQKNLSDPRYRPMPAFHQDAEDHESASAARSSSSPSQIHGTQTQGSMRADNARNREDPQDSIAAQPSGSALDRILPQWQSICEQACTASRVAANMLKHATGPLQEKNGILRIGFADEGTAAGFNHNQRAQAALSEALYKALGIHIQLEGCVGSPASDARPKVESAEAPAEPSAPAVPVTSAEPAVPSAPVAPGEPLVPAAPPSELSSALPSTSAQSPVPASLVPPSVAPLVPGVSDISDDVPFYAQEMPEPPPVQMPESLYSSSYHETGSYHEAGHQLDHDIGQRHKSHEDTSEGVEASGKESQNNAFSHEPFSREPLSSEVLSREPLSGEDFSENPWDEVSADDPDISESSLVGLNVALRIFNGKVIEEIAHDHAPNR